jgi:hypothetical protein
VCSRRELFNPIVFQTSRQEKSVPQQPFTRYIDFQIESIPLPFKLFETSEKSDRQGDKSPDYYPRRINPALKPGFKPGAVESSEL